MNEQVSITAYSGKTVRIPDYNSQSIIQIPDYIKSILGKQDTRPKLNGPNIYSPVSTERIIFFLVDGFGMSQWLRYQSNISILQAISSKGNLEIIDTVFPSSTPVALTSIYNNGMMPRNHGLIDWWMYLSQIDDIIATLPFRTMGDQVANSLYSKGVSPDTLYPGETTFRTLFNEGVRVQTFLNANYEETAYSKAIFEGSDIITHSSQEDFFTVLANKANSPIDGPELLYAYWSEIDEVGHVYGPESNEHALTTKRFFSGLETFTKKINPNIASKTQIVISADHGQIPVNPSKTLYLDDIEGFTELLEMSPQKKIILPWGGPREVFIKVKGGLINNALDLIQEKIGSHVELIVSTQAIESGLFGNNPADHSDIKSRIGDIIILPKNNSLVWYRHPNGDPITSLGQHGGLSDDEIKVPFATIMADRLQEFFEENQCN